MIWQLKSMRRSPAGWLGSQILSPKALDLAKEYGVHTPTWGRHNTPR